MYRHPIFIYENLEKFQQLKKNIDQSIKRDSNPLHSVPHHKSPNLRWPRRSLEIEHWPFDCAKRLHIGDSNLESPISNLLGHRAKRLHIGDSNLESPISNLLGHHAKRLHIGDSNLESPIS